MTAKIWAVVPAGGVGTRMNSVLPKQYLDLLDQPVIVHTLNRLCRIAAIDSLVVGAAEQDTHWRALAYTNTKLDSVVEAGAERVDTVENCLQYIVNQGGDADWALVHDAARPCVRGADIEHLINTVLAADRGGILAVPLSDTIKRSVPGSSPSCIEQTVSRDHLWRAMTPQLFPVGRLLSAIKAARTAGLDITDEASALEAAGEQALLIPCSPDNIKITLAQDLTFARMILLAQQQE